MYTYDLWQYTPLHTHTSASTQRKSIAAAISCLDKEVSFRRSFERLNGVLLLDALIKEVITNNYMYQRSQ